jgi:hypothetical protein
MLLRKFCTELTLSEIRKLHGGPIRGCNYFIGIISNPGDAYFKEVCYPKLRNQMGSQTKSGFSAGYGYEPFLFQTFEAKLCLKNMDIPMPRIVLRGGCGPRIELTRCLAKVIRTPRRSTDLHRLLTKEAELFETRQRIRQVAERSREHLAHVVSRMALDGLPACEAPDERLELYLYWRSAEFLDRLLTSLEETGSDGPASPTIVGAAA